MFYVPPSLPPEIPSEVQRSLDCCTSSLRVPNRRNARRSLLESLWSQHDGRCQYCQEGTSLAEQDRDKPVYATLDHIKPKAAGGSDVIGNLALACLRCNRSKGSTELKRWWFRQTHWDLERYLDIVIAMG